MGLSGCALAVPGVCAPRLAGINWLSSFIGQWEDVDIEERAGEGGERGNSR